VTGTFDGSHVVVVGAGGGIGSETVRSLVADGASVLAIDTDEDALSTLASRHGDSVIIRQADAADRPAMEAAFACLPHVDVHIHIAGLSGRRWGDGPIDTCTDDAWDIVMRNNVRSVYLSNQLAVRAMKPRGHGGIVNVSSILGLVGVREHFVTHAYAASRGAVISLSRSMAAYYAQFGIRVNCVAPGLLDTPMSTRAIGDPALRTALETLQPLAPHVGSPHDVAEAILFLAGERAQFITGVTLPIDGGWTAQ
jgi:NAD(P)-dependent dehydrogenase (short-subunit alcohol dehydrogenase family)